MQQHPFGPLAPVSTLTLGGGGLGMLWGPTTFEECVATVHAAVAAGITLLDLAPRYGDGKAEEVVGEAFDGHLPDGVRVTSKCNLGNPPPGEIEPTLRRSIEASLRRLRLSRLDVFFLHSNVVPDETYAAGWGDAGRRMTPYPMFVTHVRPVFEKLVAEGLIGAWGLTGIGHPDTIIRLLGERPAPAAVQCIANLLDLPGGAEVLQWAREAARDHGGGARQRRRRHGHPRGAGRRTHCRDRSAFAGRSRRGPRFCSCRWLPQALYRAWRESGSDRSPLRAVARDRHIGARGEEPPGVGRVCRRGAGGTVAARTDRPD